MAEVCASIFGLIEPSRRMPANELWAEIARDVVEEANDSYLYREDWKYRVVVREKPSISPDKKLARYRTIEASIRRRPGKATLLDLSVGNWFCEAASEPAKRLHIAGESRHSVWARHAGRIPLIEHVRLVEQFVEHVMDAGWMLERPEVTPFRVPPPMVRNLHGKCLLPTRGFGQLAKYPAVDVPPDTRIVVVATSKSLARRAATSLEEAFARCFPGSLMRGATVACSCTMVPTAVNLVLLEDREDLGENQKLRDILRQAETNGSRFKLAKVSSLSKSYPRQNIAYNLFQIAGGRPWEPAALQPAFCSMDAGHNAELRKSRWVKVESDQHQRIVDVRAILTPIAEHVPSECVDSLWPSLEDGIVCRDGRLSQERNVMEKRAADEDRPLVEVKKSPRALLWRLDGEKILPAEYGDAVLDEHGDVLLQTMPQDVFDYVHPVRLSTACGRAEEMSVAFLHQYAIPGPSLFHTSRLPGTLYFADLISKMTSDGWPKAIGRGYRISGLIP
jgi:hypothetical protein